MELVYIHAESAIRPPEIEVGVTTVYLRRNYVETQRQEMDSEKTQTIWTYEEAQMSKDEALYMLTNGQADLTQSVEDADAMNVDQEFRLTFLELGLSDADI